WKQSFIIELVAKKVDSKWNCAISILCHENSKGQKREGKQTFKCSNFLVFLHSVFKRWELN
ncbi:unnamed protein product, partial [Musa acuminata subsp. burmannicoides]